MDTLILLSLCLLSWRGIQGQHDNSTKVMNNMLGHKISLPCDVYSHDDSSTPTLQWLYEKNGKHIVIYTSGPSGTNIEESDMKSRVNVNKHMHLVIEHTKVEDEKLFTCRVEDQTGKVKESNVHLRVYKAPDDPEITMEENGIHITDEAVWIGQCETKNGFPAPNITWYKNNTQLKTGKDGVVVTTQITVKSNGLITVKSVLSSPVYKNDVYSTFYCEVSYHLSNGAFMKESDRKNFTVDYPNTEVKLFVKSQHEIIKEGDKVQLICMGDGHPQPQITLFRKDEEEPLVEDYSFSWTVSRHDSGGYICRGLSMDDFNEMEAENELHVHYLDPPVLSEKSPFIVDLGSVHSVSCRANASAHTDIHWTKDGSTIANGSDLSLSFLDYADAGRYACVASITGVPGLTKTQELLVILKGKPQVTVSPEHEEVQDGEMLTLTCTAVGNPTPKITWYINGTEVDGDVVNASDSEVISELNFRVTQNHLNGRILCKAENEINSSMEYIQLQERVGLVPTAVFGDHRGSETTVDPGSKEESETTKDPSVESRSQKSYGVVIVAVIVCILLLAVLGAVLYFLYKKGRIPCGRSGKKDITKPGEKDQIVVEMKPDSPAEESVLLPGAQDKKQQAEQERYMDLRN
ncbi:cell surface glycoprotein MUC18 [Bufo bufo]|uniref:cell surface glycoprotein MUC18 n=1 Tax=Bufo bufo TaxID=8384 RepID=UPI001ABEA63E|nr:cell surface glycoprotein MUC18 [Bufo bufo]